MKNPEFVIYAYPWDENVGGYIVLHTLCARLTELGYAAAVWPSWKPGRPTATWRSLRSWLAYFLRGLFFEKFDTGPFKLKIAGWKDLDDAVIVYPEIVTGNPLGAQRAVRWLLYSHRVGAALKNYGSDDLFFYYNEAFDDPGLHDGRDHLLRVSNSVPAYRQWNFGTRRGSCVMVRKGANRKLDLHPADAIPVDGLSHDELATIFNQVETCYCYDLYTYFSIYAAVCGCVPILAPQAGLSEDEWEPEVLNRYGLAYGQDRVEWALNTRELLLTSMKDKRSREDETVHRFAAIVRKKYDFPD